MKAANPVSPTDQERATNRALRRPTPCRALPSASSVADLRDAARAIAATGIKPVIDQTFALDETAQAYARLASGGQHFGKITIAH